MPKKMKKALIIGAGALGSAFLSSTKDEFDEITIFDGDVISKENLKNQPFYRDADFNKIISKANFAAEKMNSINPKIKYYSYNKYFTKENIEFVKDYDIVLDFTDNIKSRLIINKAVVEFGKPTVFASINEKELFLFFYKDTKACFNCLIRNANGRIREGCESLVLPPSEKTIDFMHDKITDFIIGKINGGELQVFSLYNKKNINIKIKKDENCEECSLHSFKIASNSVVQLCASGLKFSLGREIDFSLLQEEFKDGRIIDEYFIYRNRGKSVIISSKGDFLFTGYQIQEAKHLISILFDKYSK